MVEEEQTMEEAIREIQKALDKIILDGGGDEKESLLLLLFLKLTMFAG